MSNTLPELENASIFYPAYLRKLARKGHWFSGIDVQSELDSVINKCFPADDNNNSLYSLYKLDSIEDLHFVAFGLHQNRGLSSADNIDVMLFSPKELELSNGEIFNTSGDTDCKCCNQRHVDVRFARSDLELLCSNAKNRQPIRIPKSFVSRLLSTFDCKKCVD
jgi:hypothetical protein